MNLNEIHFRRKVEQSDVESVRDIVTSTGYFNAEEIDIAAELVEENLAKGEASGYEFIFADNERSETLGYSCYGKIPGTKNSYALYWIAVHEKFRNHGLGRILLKETETDIFNLSGTGIYVETSSREQYTSTRAFYANNGYDLKARFEDYYDKGDDLVFFVKKKP
ncbi:MAG: GNAT family N-acetyltransferase [Bacteroidales bacterium]|nr:GNAT family N-acetyltransferase [Bacteroidales bacterium]